MVYIKVYLYKKEVRIEIFYLNFLIDIDIPKIIMYNIYKHHRIHFHCCA